MIAVKGTTSARPHDAVPEALAYGGMGRPSVPRYRTAPVSLRQLAIAHADQIQQVTWRQGTKATQGNPDRRHDQLLPSDPGPARQPPHPPRRRRQPAGMLAAGRMAAPRPMSPPTTGCLTCPKTLPSPNSSGWPRSAGGSSTTTAN